MGVVAEWLELWTIDLTVKVLIPCVKHSSWLTEGRFFFPSPWSTISKPCWGWNSSLVVCRAHCPAWCSVMGSIVFWGKFFSGRGFFPLELTWVLFPKNSFGWEYKPRSSLCTHAFHRMDSKDPDSHVLDGWMLATKTHPACTIHERLPHLEFWLSAQGGCWFWPFVQPLQVQTFHPGADLSIQVQTFPAWLGLPTGIALWASWAHRPLNPTVAR